MKAVMYHYVREHEEDLPHFVYLHIDSFRAQLDHLEAECGFVGREEFLAAARGEIPCPKGAVLTFDDGFRDHYDHVLPELVSRGLWGLFYIPTGVYENQRILDVHKTHLMLGAHGDETAMKHLAKAVERLDISKEAVEKFTRITYHRQDNTAATNEFKRMLNYFADNEQRSRILETLEQSLPLPRDASSFYLDADQMDEMRRSGMLMGNHGHRHIVYSRHGREAVEEDIDLSTSRFDALVPGEPLRHFCYPYGAHSCTDHARRYLTDKGYAFAFSVDPRDVNDEDLPGDRMALPRHPCHLLPHGRANIGDKPPA